MAGLAGASQGAGEAALGGNQIARALALASLPPIGRARWLSHGARRISLAVESPRPALLLLRQPWAEGWRATITRDGGQGKLNAISESAPPPRPLGPGLMGLNAPAGECRIDLEFTPKLWRMAVMGGWGLATPLLLIAAWFSMQEQKHN